VAKEHTSLSPFPLFNAIGMRQRLSRLHARLGLRLPVSSSTCHIRPFLIAAELCELREVDLSFLPAQLSYKMECRVRKTDATL